MLEVFFDEECAVALALRGAVCVGDEEGMEMTSTSSGICTGGRSGGFIIEFGVGIEVVLDALETRNSFDRE